MTKPTVTILDACNDPALFARWFKTPETWQAWFAFLRVLFGLLMDEQDVELFRRCTGRESPPTGGAKEAWLVCGRRAGKSFILALVAVFLACFRDWSQHLSPGERGTVIIVAADKKQARTIYRYAAALLREVPLLKALIARDTAEAIDLKNDITIEILTASFRTIRGYSVVAALCDEIAFWRSDESAANPDAEIVGAIRPAMATVPGAMLLCASSPYARRGALWTTFRKHFGKDSPTLVWQADTRTMNPTVDESVITEAYEADPASAAAEYGAEFRTDVETFVSREVIDAAVVPGRHELAPVPGISYIAAVDPAGGSGTDSMTLAIAHRDADGRAILDAVRERRPKFSPLDVVAEFAALLKAYGVHKVTGDRWGGEFVRQPFRAHGVDYALAERVKSDFYRDALPILNSSKAELLDVPRLGSQLANLERRTARSGKDSIDHPPNQNDDVANVSAMVLVLAASGQPAIDWVAVAPGLIQQAQEYGMMRRAGAAGLPFVPLFRDRTGQI